MKLLTTALFATACALAAPGAAAQNWVTLLKNTPAESFDDEDLRLFLDTARKALDGGAPENQPLGWENPKSRNRGEITVLRSFEWKGRSCKEVRVRHIFAASRWIRSWYTPTRATCKPWSAWPRRASYRRGSPKHTPSSMDAWPTSV